MFYQISLLLLLLSARMAFVDSHEVIYTDIIDPKKHTSVQYSPTVSHTPILIPSETLSSRPTSAPTSISVCATVNQSSVATISCPSSTIVRTIDFASYGTPTGSCGAFSKGWCDSSDSMSVVTRACLNQANCSVPAQVSDFGDPCFMTYKQLYIQVTCALTPSLVCATVEENNNATISCPSGSFVRTINFASYGLPGGYCGTLFSYGECHSSNSMSVVENTCLNQANCTIPAQNEVFGDPCGGTRKSLYIEAVCDH